MSRAKKFRGHTFVSNPAIRIEQSASKSDSKWRVVDLAHGRQFSLSAEGVWILVTCRRPHLARTLTLRLAKTFARPALFAKTLIAALVEHELLYPDEHSTSKDPGISRTVSVRRLWSAHGWIDAAEYYLRSYNYPFLKNQPTDLETASQVMRRYSRSEPDIQRYKAYAGKRTRISLPSPQPSDSSINPLYIGVSDRIRPTVELNLLGHILAITFGITGTLPTQWNGAPLLQRTSPSGGARHPTEAYLLALDVNGLECFWYHIQLQPLTLVKIKAERPTIKCLRSLFPQILRNADFTIKAIVILTTCFGRNMYRYREPRTFRTVHLDAGHVCGTLEAVSAAAGFRTLVQYGCDDSQIDKLLGLNPLLEGIQLCVGIG